MIKQQVSTLSSQKVGAKVLDYESPGYLFLVKPCQFTATAPTHAGSKLKLTKSDEAESNGNFNTSKTVDEMTMIKRKNSSS